MRDVSERGATPDDRQSSAERRAEQCDAVRQRETARDTGEDTIDQAIETTFPASDPPSWTAT